MDKSTVIGSSKDDQALRMVWARWESLDVSPFRRFATDNGSKQKSDRVVRDQIEGQPNDDRLQQHANRNGLQNNLSVVL